MKTNKLLTRLAFLIMLSIFMFGCYNEEINNPEPIPTKTSVQFASKQGNISENSEEIVINLTFNTPAKEAGTIKVKVDTSLAKHFTTQPSVVLGTITMSINKSATAAAFKLKPTDTCNAKRGHGRFSSLQVLLTGNPVNQSR
jgi:hypothetical protein